MTPDTDLETVLRPLLAGLAMHAMLSRAAFSSPYHLAVDAVAYADAMIQRLREEPAP
jgi:hypothetical protein